MRVRTGPVEPGSEPKDVTWHTLLPAEGAVGWLSIDSEKRQIRIVPLVHAVQHAAAPDRSALESRNQESGLPRRMNR